MPGRSVLFGAGLGAWNGADASDVAGISRLVAQADGDGLAPAAVPAPPVWTGLAGPASLAVTGRLADGWIPSRGSDWLSAVYRESRPPGTAS